MSPKACCILVAILFVCPGDTARRLAMQQLYEDLLFFYVPEVRPAEKPQDVLLVHFTAMLIQIMDLNEKDQVFKTNLWLELEWRDYRLSWDPLLYDNITTLHIPACKVWIPDMVVYNNAAGAPQITIFTDVLVTHKGRVVWKPPMLGNSFCNVEIAKFPYDEQECYMKFGTWSYDAEYVDLAILRYYETPMGDNKTVKDIGMDLSYYYRSAEWDILNVTAVRHDVVYAGCCGNTKYVDITFNFHLRRLPLFYSANMMLPCGMIGVLSMLAYMLPADSKQRMTLCISILVSLSVFFLLLVEIMPATSAGIPIMGKYILFNMISISTTIAITTVTLNLHHRSSDFPISPLMRWLIIEKLGRYINVVNPKEEAKRKEMEERERQMASTAINLPPFCSARAQAPTANCHVANSRPPPPPTMFKSLHPAHSLDDPQLDPIVSLNNPQLHHHQHCSNRQMRPMNSVVRSSTDSGLMGGVVVETTTQPAYSSHSLDEPTPKNAGNIGGHRVAMLIGCAKERALAASAVSCCSDEQLDCNKDPAFAPVEPVTERKKPPLKRQGSWSLDSVAEQATKVVDPKLEILLKTLNNVIYIGEQCKLNVIREQISIDWSILAMVIDRLCLRIYTFLTFAINIWFVVQIPTLYDRRQPLGSPEAHSPLGYAYASEKT